MRSSPVTPADCRIYLALDVGPAGPAPRELAHLLQRTGVASVLLCAANATAPAASRIAEIVRAAQSQEVAALVADDARLAREIGADGVHLTDAGEADYGAGAYAAARETLGKTAIVGAAAGLSRHRAMVLGELGADYIAFGNERQEGDGIPRRELIAWWAELFEPPCVAWCVSDAREAGELVAAGADFIAVHGRTLDEAAAALGWLAPVLGNVGAAS